MSPRPDGPTFSDFQAAIAESGLRIERIKGGGYDVKHATTGALMAPRFAAFKDLGKWFNEWRSK